MEVVSAKAGVLDGQPCVTVIITGDDPARMLKRIVALLDGRAIGLAHDVGCEDTQSAIADFLDTRELHTAAAMVRDGTYRQEPS